MSDQISKNIAASQGESVDGGVDTDRTPLDLSQRLPFEHIIKKHEHEYDFCVINDSKHSIQRHEMAGWKVWKGDRLFESEFDKATDASRVKDGYTSVPCGIAGDGKPTSAYLMFAPKGHAQKIIDARHAENRLRKQAYGQKAKQNASSQIGGGIETYTPEVAGVGSDGLGVMPNTIDNGQS